MSFQDIELEIDDDVARLTLNRPEKYNALSMNMEEEIWEAVDQISRDGDINFVVIKGEGGNFSTGDDITEMTEWGDPADVMRRATFYQRISNEIEYLDKITIAAVDGYATGGGLEITLVCDFVIATDRAEWGMPEVNWDITPGWGGTTRLTRYLGRRKTKEANLTGKLYPVEEAVENGIWNRAVAPDQLDEEVEDLLELLKSKNPHTLRQMKIAIDYGAEAPLHTALGFERLNSSLTAANAWGLGPTKGTGSPGEGLKAFSEKDGLYKRRRELADDFWRDDK